MKYKMTILYEGTRFGGWQIQPNVHSIQGEIETALKILLKNRISIIAAGRTDAGVHALAQVAHFNTEISLNEKQVLKSLNGILPHDIRIKHLEQVARDFHARYSAKRKIYRYYLHLGPVHPPFKRLYSHHIPTSLDIQLLKKASAFFIGTHDFKAFANAAHEGAANKNAVRTIYRLDVIQEDDGLFFEFEGDGFLYKMVRNIVGTLIEVAKGKISIDSLPLILSSKDRRKAGKAISPRGLFLIKIIY